MLRAGSSYRKNGTIIPIAEVTPHPEYDNPSFDKDVAVMKTVEAIQFTETIKAIALPESGRPMVADTIVDVSGWGRTRVRTKFITKFSLNLLLLEFRTKNLSVTAS